MTLVDAFVVAGAVVVLPLAIPRVPRAVWLGVAVSALVALSLPEGRGAALVASPWAIVALLVVAAEARTWSRQPTWSMGAVIDPASAGFAAVAGLALVQSCLGRPAFGVHEPIIELTAVHFAYAGAGAAALAGHVWQRVRMPGLATAAVVLTIGAPPVVAIGFLTDAAGPQIGGAVLMTGGVWATAAGQLVGWRDRAADVRALLAISSTAVFVAMPLAVAWALAQHWGDVPALSIPDMVRTHGMLNGVLFVPLGLLAWRRPDELAVRAGVPIS